jgi:putative acetyltransferase
MAVSEGEQGRGLGSTLLSSAIELCEGWLGVHRMELETYTDNLEAITLFKKHGFVIEGTAIGYALRAGAFVDVNLMARRING